MKRLTAILLSLILLTGCITAFAENVENSQERYVLAGLDTAQYGMGGALGGSSYRSWNDNLFFKRMETLTCVGFELRQYTDPKAWTDAKAAMTAGADMPDVLFKASLSSAECMEMRERGALIDLLPLLKENCPNLWAILQNHPDYLAAITLPDGSVPALPYIYSTPLQNCIWINCSWLESLKLKEPTTAEELKLVLEAFRDRDPNGNGQQDEIPLGFLGAFDLKYLAHAFGLYANDYNIYVEDGIVRFMPLDEQFRSFVAWCRELYTEKLLDNDGFSTADTMRAVSDQNAKPTYGAIITTNAGSIFSTSWAADYKPLMPLAYDGVSAYRETVGRLLRGAFAVTSACEEPEKMLKWVDALYGETGARLAYIGLENVDYLIDGDGTWRYTDTVASDSLFSINSLITGGGSLPGAAVDDFQKQYNDAALGEITERLERAGEMLVQPFPYCHLTRAQQAQVTEMQNEIGLYVDMQIVRWVLGEIEISDETFGEFEAELNRIRLPEFLAFWQDVYDHL